MREIAVFGGSAHPELVAEISGHLEVPLLPSKLQHFANDCLVGQASGLTQQCPSTKAATAKQNERGT